jgi:hypothetical protein
MITHNHCSRCPLLDAAEERIDDLAAYRLLIDLAAQTRLLSDQCWSTPAKNALAAGSAILRDLASALYRAVRPG